MSITIDGTVPPNSESPRNGATRIRNLANALLGLLNLPGATSQTVGGPFITSLDAGGVPTFVDGSLVNSDPTNVLGLVTKQYADAKVPFVVTSGGDAYTATFADIPVLIGGQYIVAKFSAANTTTAPTLNLNATGAIPIKTGTGGAPAVGAIAANSIFLLIYDNSTGTWVLASSASAASTGVRVLDRQSGNPAVDVVSTATETSVYNFSLIGGTLGINQAARLTLLGDFLNNTGGGQSFLFKVIFGGATALTSAITTVNQTVNRRPVSISVIIQNLAVTNAQIVTGDLAYVSAATGNGIFEPTSLNKATAITAVDTTIGQTIQVTVTLGISSGSVEYRQFGATLELL